MDPGQLASHKPADLDLQCFHKHTTSPDSAWRRFILVESRETVNGLLGI